MIKEANVNTDKLETLIAILTNLDSGSLAQVVAALEVELWDRDARTAEELFKEAFDDMLASQYA